MSVYTKPNSKVIFMFPKNGYNPDIESANKHLIKGKEYTVKRTEVHSWHTEVELKEIPNIVFNSSMFANIT